MKLLDEIMQRAKNNPQRIVLPEGTEIRTLQAANIILKEKAAKLILLGNKTEIDKIADKNGLKYIKEAKIINPETHPDRKKYGKLLYEIRKSKGMTYDEDEK